jgi:hypothetical protein
MLKDAEGVNMATITKFNNFLMNHGLYYWSAIKAAIAQSTKESDEAGRSDEQSPHELLNWVWVRALGCGTYGQVHLVRRTTDSKIAAIKLVQVSQAGAKNMNNDEKRRVLEREMTDASRPQATRHSWLRRCSRGAKLIQTFIFVSWKLAAEANSQLQHTCARRVHASERFLGDRIGAHPSGA